MQLLSAPTLPDSRSIAGQRSWYAALAEIHDVEWTWVVTPQGQNVPVLDIDDVWHLSVGDMLPSNYVYPFAHQSMNWKAFTLAAPKPFIMSTADWYHGHDLTAEECPSDQVVAFELPSTMDAYYASLSKKHRYDARRYAKNGASMLRMAHEVPWAQFDHLLSCYCERLMTHMEHEPDVALTLCRCVEAFARAGEQAGTLRPLALYAGERCVALNIAEQVGNRMLDSVSLYDDSFSSLGSTLISLNIEHAIDLGCRWYDMGLMTDRLVQRSYEYKRTWVPERTSLPWGYHIACVPSDMRLGKPYFDFETKELLV